MKHGQLYKSLRTGRYFVVRAHYLLGVAGFDAANGGQVCIKLGILSGNNYRSTKP